jgi:hypothetical protein
VITDLIVFGILSFLVIVLLINSFRLQLKVKKLTANFLQYSLDRAVIIGNLKEQLDQRKPDDVEKTDGFLKFISESRDWAFKYIEDVQAALATFKNKVEPKFEYSNTYGSVGGKTAHLDIIQEIEAAYLELKKVLPEDDAKKEKDK